MKTIKIAHVITRLILGGAQENTLLSVIGLKEISDYSVDLITGPAIGPEGSLMDRAEKEALSVIQIDELRRNINPFLDLLAFIKLIYLFKKNQYDVIHSHSSKAGIICRLAAAVSGCKIIIHTIHGLPFHDYQNNFSNIFYIFLERICAYFTTRIIVVCPEMSKKALAEKIGNLNQYTTIFSGIETQAYQNVDVMSTVALRRTFNIPENAIVIGKIARLFHLKGHDDFLLAANNIIRRHSNVYFLIVGDGVLLNELQQKAITYGIEKNIIFTGLIPTEDIPKHIACMDFVVHLSYREGLARVIPQAFLLKKPVIAYNVDGAKDIIDDSINGFLISIKDIESLIDKIDYLILNPDRRVEMGLNGYSKAVNIFPYEKMVSALDSLYRSLIA
jgi:glycosyltransferase involved in cell wall biosynthesis